MLTKKRSLAIVVMAACLAMALTLLAGCSGTDKAATESPDNNATQTETVDLMADRTITDDAGREVTIPGVGALQKIYYTGAPGQIFCFTLAPELAAGTTMEFSDAELAYLPEGTGDLPYLGTLSGGKELNPEAIMAEGVQVIFSVTTGKPGDSDASSADDLQSQTGIPVVVLDGTLDATPTT